ncbi:unknown [Salmonella phage FelixO1]|uniref:Uncharacterized protein n=1 Tax=Salmonella phage Felix O1 (isolate Felix O1-VT1) TaxID=1283336 RepID=Q6KGA3_BPFO1|nr:unknown [Salmonella phage FelixO1]
MIASFSLLASFQVCLSHSSSSNVRPSSSTRILWSANHLAASFALSNESDSSAVSLLTYLYFAFSTTQAPL